MREPGSRLRLELVARQVLGLERQRVAQIAVEVGGALAGDPVQQVERDVVKIGITEMVERAPDSVRAGPPLEHLEQLGAEALRTERDTRHPMGAQKPGQLGRNGLRIGLDRHLRGRREPVEETGELGGRGEGGGPTSEEDRLELGSEDAPLELKLRQQRIDVPPVLAGTPHHSDEVAVSAAMPAEGEVDVQVTDARAHFLLPSRLRTARNASCGTSTAPTCFIRFFPAFWRSSSLRLRVMSPP